MYIDIHTYIYIYEIYIYIYIHIYNKDMKSNIYGKQIWD